MSKVRTLRNAPELAQQISDAITSGMPCDRDKILRLIESNSLSIAATMVDESESNSFVRVSPSTLVLDYCRDNNISAFSNQNIAAAMEAVGVTVEMLLPEVEAAMAQVLTSACIDHENDHNSEGTPRRYAKMILQETWTGRYEREPRITDFPNASNTDQLIVAKRLRIESLCSHHHQNIRGYAWIGVLPHPDGKVIGLSKFSRIVRHFSRRPQIQEELTVQIADYLMEVMQPRGVAVLIDAEHQCMGCRGVMEPDASTATTHLLGEFRESTVLRAEFEARIAHVPHRV